MKASEANLLAFLQGTKQFIIPIYQRTYSWTLKECQQLWDDIMRAARDESVSGHFVGSVVYVEKGLYQISAVPQLLVIDGQQRLTTLTLLLTALGKAAEENGDESEISRRRINNYYLFNPEEDHDLRYKLLLTRSDRESLIKILEDTSLPDTESGRLVDNYNFFREQINRSGLTPADIFRGIQKLIVVDIALNREHDNPQLIFESLNSTGLELSQADLIRNFILMGLAPEEQETLYKDHWYPMEQSFGHANYTTLFDRFMRDFLTVKTGRIPNIREVYVNFKSYANGRDSGSVSDIVAEIHRFSRYFVNLALEKESNDHIRASIHDINTLKVDVAYPFFLNLYADYEVGILSQDDFIQLLQLVESYVIRRAICGIPTNSLNKTFQNLSREVDKANYLESTKAAFLMMESFRRFPRDEEFINEFVVKDIYNLTNRRNYLLRKLENHERKEVVNIEAFTIEHIMPQNENLSLPWQRNLGPDWKAIQSRYLHTFGNLTLTGYNPELSDRPFLEKRDMEGGFADSPLRLNRELAKLDTWNVDEIRRRSRKLATLATKVWPAPELSAAVLDSYRKVRQRPASKSYTLADHPNLTGELLELFNRLQHQILNLDPSVTETILSLYIAYKVTTNFVDIVPQKSRLRLSLNMAFNEIIDPLGWCNDVTNLGRWGNGDVELFIEHPDQLEYTMELIRQSFAIHAEDVAA